MGNEEVFPKIMVEETTEYENYLKYYKNLTSLFAANHVLNEKVKFYWDGNQMTIGDFNKNIKSYTFDLQDGFSLKIFIVNWILSILYTSIDDVINVMLSYKYQLNPTDMNYLKCCLESIYKNVPLIKDNISEYVFKRFFIVVENFNGDDIKYYIYYI